MISNILRLSHGVPRYIAKIAWIAPMDLLALEVKLAPIDLLASRVIFTLGKAIMRGKAFVPTKLLVPTSSLAHVMSLAPAMLLALAVC